MILGVKKLLDLVKKEKLIDGLCERELTNPEGAGFDIRVGEIYEMEGDGFLGVEERETPKIKLVAQYKKDKSYILKPGDYVLMSTLEVVNVPENLVMLTFPRSTLQRCGVLLIATQCAPGYNGKMTYALTNLGKNDLKLELGARVAHVMFYDVDGGGSSYRGQWQGGRVTTTKKEKQV